MSRAIIALMSDFGLRDPYLATLKGTLLGLNREAQLVDLTHNIPPGNVLAGALVLDRCANYFPDDTIFVAAVDPGVDGLRRPLLIDTDQGRFVGPDNGVLTFAATRRIIRSVRELTNPAYFAKRVHNTYHGRDIFAAVAGHLSLGVALSEFGPERADFLQLHFPSPLVRKDHLTAQVLWVDRFGNLVSNVTRDELPAQYRITVGNDCLTRVVRSYESLPPGQLGAVWGSHGFLEVALAGGSAALKTGYSAGVPLRIELA